MFESVKAFAAEVRVERAKAALRRAQAREVRRLEAARRQARKVAAAARRVDKAARRWEVAREAEAVRDLRAMARRNLRRGTVLDLTPRSW